MSDGITLFCPNCKGNATHKEGEFYNHIEVFFCDGCGKRYAIERVVKNNKAKRFEEIIKTFCEEFCVSCKGRIAVLCGTPIIKIGGCCSKIECPEINTDFVRQMSCHYHCYLDAKGKVKTNWKFKEIEKIVSDNKVVPY